MREVAERERSIARYNHKTFNVKSKKIRVAMLPSFYSLLLKLVFADIVQLAFSIYATGKLDTIYNLKFTVEASIEVAILLNCGVIVIVFPCTDLFANVV